MCLHKYVFTLLKDIRYKRNKQVILFILGFLMGLKKGAAFPTHEPPTSQAEAAERSE